MFRMAAFIALAAVAVSAQESDGVRPGSRHGALRLHPKPDADQGVREVEVENRLGHHCVAHRGAVRACGRRVGLTLSSWIGEHKIGRPYLRISTRRLAY